MKCIALFYLNFLNFYFVFYFLRTKLHSILFFWRVYIFWKSIFSVFSCQLLTRSWSEANATRQNFKTNWQCEFSKLVHWVWKASERQSLSLVLLLLVLPQSQLTQAALRVLLRSLEFALSWPANSGKFCLALFGKFSWRAFAAGDSDEYMKGCWNEQGRGGAVVLLPWAPRARRLAVNIVRASWSLWAPLAALLCVFYEWIICGTSKIIIGY